jgi:hypothetical protein
MVRRMPSWWQYSSPPVVVQPGGQVSPSRS